MYIREFNKLEKVQIEPQTTVEGNIWFNTTEDKIKIKTKDGVETILTDAKIEDMVEQTIEQSKVKIELEDIDYIKVQHNKNTLLVNGFIYDDSQNIIPVTLTILDENTIELSLVEKVTGTLILTFS